MPAAVRLWPRIVSVFWVAEFAFGPRRNPERVIRRDACRHDGVKRSAKRPFRRRGAWGRRPVDVKVQNGAGIVRISSDPERLAMLCRDRICPAGGTRCPFGDACACETVQARDWRRLACRRKEA